MDWVLVSLFSLADSPAKRRIPRCPLPPLPRQASRPPGPGQGEAIVGKAPGTIKEDAEAFLEWCAKRQSPSGLLNFRTRVT